MSLRRIVTFGAATAGLEASATVAPSRPATDTTPKAILLIRSMRLGPTALLPVRLRRRKSVMRVARLLSPSLRSHRRGFRPPVPVQRGCRVWRWNDPPFPFPVARASEHLERPPPRRHGAGSHNPARGAAATVAMRDAEQALQRGIWDGTRPDEQATRAEAAALALRAVRLGVRDDR